MADDAERKTFNDLAPEFQWNNKLDPEHIFDEEKKLIAEVRKKVPSMAQESDKFVLVFLIARRHDVGETVTLLNKFKKLQADFNIQSDAPPSFTNDPVLVNLRSNVNNLTMLQPPGARDIHNRMLRYFFMGENYPTEREPKEIYMLLFWQTYYLLQEEPLSVWRNGIAVVIDLKDFGWKNVDMSAKGRAVNKDLQGAFPFRMRAFFVINGSGVINALMAAAKMFLPKKIVSRVSSWEVNQLKDMIPPKHLLTKYGGEETMDMQAWVDFILKREQEFFASGAWKQKA